MDSLHQKCLFCPACEERFTVKRERQPIVLSCEDTVCRECAGYSKTTEKAKCPKEGRVDQRNLSEIAPSYSVLELIEENTRKLQTITYLKLPPQAKIQAVREQAKANREEVERCLEGVERRLAESTRNQLSATRQIRELFCQLAATLRAREEALICEVSELAGDYIQQLESVRKRLVNKQLEVRQREEDLLKDDAMNGTCLFVYPLTELPEPPAREIRVKFLCKAMPDLDSIAGVAKCEVPHVCGSCRTVTYWKVPPCCKQHYCCEVCHDSSQQHIWVHPDRMVCMYCFGEQDYRDLENNCEHCGALHTKIITK